MSIGGLYTGLSGVRAAQTGMDITSHNIANSATKGYTRQRVELAARPTYDSPVGQVGTGVSVERIGRLRDGFLDIRYRGAVAESADATVRAEGLGTLESLAGEPDQGISVRLGQLWTAAEAWANGPADPASRQQVLTELASVSETVRSTSAAWDDLETDLVARREIVAEVASDTLRSLAKLDREIAGTDPSRVGGDLLDQRDLMLDELARTVGAKVGLDEDGRASVTLGAGENAIDLLEGGAWSLGVDEGGEILARPPEGHPERGTAWNVGAVVGGELGGLHGVLTKDIPERRTELDEFARVFADAVNTVNAGGRTTDGEDGAPLLVGVDARSLALAEDVGPDDLAAGETAAPGDGRNARVFADLRIQPVNDDGEAADDGTTIQTRLADLVVRLAGDVRAAQTDADAAQGVASGAGLARSSEHGVSIDEEMVGLVRYQRALEASSRVMTTMDEALDVLINRTGLVGR